MDIKWFFQSFLTYPPKAKVAEEENTHHPSSKWNELHNNVGLAAQ